MAPRKPSATAEVALVQLKNCLVNLPPSLVSLLVNANTVGCFPNGSDWAHIRLGCAKYYRRTAVSLYREDQWRIFAVVLFGVDGDAE